LLIRILLRGLRLIIPCLALSLTNPPLLVVLLVVQSVLVVCFVGLIKRIWYSYILFIVFLGGILVIFVYVRRLVVNTKSSAYSNLFKFWVIILLRVCTSLGLSSVSLLLGEVNIRVIREEFVIQNLISYWSRSTYLYVVIYLLLVLYCVCWLVKSYEGPLRNLK